MPNQQIAGEQLDDSSLSNISASAAVILSNEPQATQTERKEQTSSRIQDSSAPNVSANLVDQEQINVQPIAAEPSVGDLTMQLVSVSSRNLARGACAVAASTYTMAQRVAELGLQQLNEQLQRRGIFFDDKERENLKAVLLMLLLVISAIFLLGLGKQRLSNHWDFYFPN